MVNHVVLQGRLVEDPKCGQSNGGTDYANFRVAWSRKYKEKDIRCFIDCKAFGGTAKFVEQYFGKGHEIAVEGELNTEEWEKDGQKRSKIVLVVSSAHFCGSKRDGASEPAQAPAEPQGGFTAVETDELPF